MSGTDTVANAQGTGRGVLMKNHGIIPGARSLRRTSGLPQIIERTAEIIIGCHTTGQKPPLLPDEVVKELSQGPDLMA